MSISHGSAWSRASSARRAVVAAVALVGVIAAMVLIFLGPVGAAGIVLGVAALVLVALQVTTPGTSD